MEYNVIIINKPRLEKNFDPKKSSVIAVKNSHDNYVEYMNQFFFKDTIFRYTK